MRSRSQVRKSSPSLRIAAKDLAAVLAILAPMGLASAQSTMPLIIDAGDAAPKPEAPAAEAPAEASVLSDVVVSASAIPSLASEATSGIGFAKPLLETPRAVSLINEDQLNLLGIKQVEDMVRAVPGTYTTTRYGLQGGVNIRGISADVYWRGMKRLTAQGHYRTDMSALSSVEIVKGAAPPIFGLGRIGGYVNQQPRSGAKSQAGTYLSDITGFVQGVVGSFNKTELSTGVGGPINAFGHQGGYYVYGLMENSGTYIRQVGAQQKILQTAMTVNNAFGPFRLETGFQAQNSKTSGAYMNRVTQALLSDGRYVIGQPLVNLDAGAGSDKAGLGDGYVGFREQHANSPVTGAVSAANRPLDQAWAWPTCTGANAADAFPGTNLCVPGKFPVQPGIPASLKSYLDANPGKDPTGKLRAAAALGTGPALTTNRQVPVGFFLDPTTTGFTQVDFRRNGAFERLQDANVGLAWFDLIYDTDPNFTVKFQTFTDNLDTFKDSYLPYGEKQGLHRFEERLTVTKKLPEKWSPSWLDVNTLSSISYRRTSGYIRSSSGDFDYRQDVMYRDPQYGDGLHYPNTKFWNQLANPSWLTGAPAELERKSVYDEFGAGVMFDVNLFKNTNLMFGGRWDGSTARAEVGATNNQQRPGLANSCVLPAASLANPTSAAIAAATTPLAVLQSGACKYGSTWDDGRSWAVSLSHQLPGGIRPYITLQNVSVVLDGANNTLTPNIVDPGRAGVASSAVTSNGHIGAAKLKEVGVKGDWFKHKLYASAALYEQSRADVSSAVDPTAGADSSSTVTKGLEMQIDANPTNKFHVGMYAVGQQLKYVINTNSTFQLTGRQLGYQDIKDDAGNVIYPAEAFVYGGRVQVALPTALVNSGLYNDRVGEPRYQVGVNVDYKLPWGFAVHVDGQRFSAHYMDRLKLQQIPQSFVLNSGVTWDSTRVHFKVSGFNILDERYFRAGNGDVNMNLVSVMSGAAVQFQGKVDF